MKKQFFFIIIYFLGWASFSQSKIENIFFSKNNDGSYKFYFNESFKLTCENNADYYSTLHFNPYHFVLEDSLKIYFSKDKKLHLKGFYENGYKEGEFIWYYASGTVKSIGYYDDDKRVGTWRNYYKNGQLNKEIVYENELPFLKSFYLENGAQLVYDGEGTFMDEIPVFNSPKNIQKIKGTIKDGLMDGKWNMYIKNTIIASEYFENKTFIKGVSLTKANPSEYTDTYFCTFLETVFLEKIRFESDLYCGVRPGGSKIQFYTDLFESIKKNYIKSELSKEISNGWFFIKISYDSKGTIILPEIISNQSDEINNKLLALLYKTKKEYVCYNVDVLISIAFVDNEIYLSDSNQIRLFSGL